MGNPPPQAAPSTGGGADKVMAIRSLQKKHLEESGKLAKDKDNQIKAASEVIKSKYTADKKTLEAKHKQELAAIKK